uniref:MICOS complex subunit MIC25 n=1 Tax=Monopterus albus TaxID=43700 RepID=A0A3Q3J662_MONAL
MGSGESTTRKVSFGVDDEDRVRILRGVKLSEDVLQRMRGVANIAPEPKSSSSSSPQKDTGLSHSASSSSRPQDSGQSSTQSSTSKPASYTEEEQKRYGRQQTILKEELAKIQREREAAWSKALNWEHTREEAEKAKQLTQQLQKKDSQLKALDAFYKEQLAQLEKRVSQYRPSVFWPAGSDFILLQGEWPPDPKVFRPCQRIHAVYKCCKEEPAGKPWMKSERKRVKQLLDESFYFGPCFLPVFHGELIYC